MNSGTIRSGRQYLAFTLDREVYALDILAVREILDDKTITSIPQLPDYVLGVINLRGQAITVVDLKQRLGMEPVHHGRDTCIVIADMVIDNEESTIGLLVDSVHEVIDLDDNAIQQPPKVGHQIETTFIKGMGRRDDAFIIILDLDLVIAAEEAHLIRTAAALHEALVSPAPGSEAGV